MANFERVLKSYIDKVAGFKGATLAEVVLEKDVNFSRLALDLVVPHGGSPAQKAVLDRIVAYGASRGVLVNIIVLP